jgi:hypothetical protein
MIDPTHLSARVERAPSAEELWARVEASSATAAADLKLKLNEAPALQGPVAEPRPGFLRRLARIVIPGVEVVRAFHHFR